MIPTKEKLCSIGMFVGLCLWVLSALLSAANAQTQPKFTKASSKTGGLAASAKLFEFLGPDRTGVDFVNIVPGATLGNKAGNDDSIRYYGDNVGFIEGGGLAVGDLNGDGLPDIYLASVGTRSQLYYNRGGFRFEAAPASAGVQDSSGVQAGVTLVDIDADGDLDIYLCKYGTFSNVLYINNGDGTFTNRIAEFGLDFPTGNSIQSTFFDYDRDGDLDMYLVVNGDASLSYAHTGGCDRLFRNNGNNTFTDVTKEAGIFDEAFGLSATVGDFNNDGWPDLYVGNDYEGRDELYYNNKNGTFRKATRRELRHVSYFGMGTEVGDINNDGWLDLMCVDMHPRDHKRLNTQYETIGIFSKNFDSSQFIRNTLQLNRGDGTFSEIAHLADVARTDWSWTVLFADFDHDGNKDIYVTNGLKIDISDTDAMFSVRVLMAEDTAMNTEDQYSIIKRFTQLTKSRIPNYIFRNTGDLGFEESNAEWGTEHLLNTSSAAYADFDLDGDLDLVLLNTDSVTTFYKNTAREKGLGDYLRIKLEGARPNTFALGARVYLHHGRSMQMQELTLSRGFCSAVEPIVHFGFPKATAIDSLVVVWPDGSTETLKKPSVNKLLVVKQKSGLPRWYYSRYLVAESDKLFQPVNSTVLSKHISREDDFDDYYQDRLLPRRISMQGPSLAVADINSDGFADLFVGGAAGKPSTVYLGNKNGDYTISQQPFLTADSAFEDQQAVFFDYDNDSKVDLIVSSGQYERVEGVSAGRCRPRIYRNVEGVFQPSDAFRFTIEEGWSGSCIALSDFNNDGYVDVFLGGRNVPGDYPKPSRSYLLMNSSGSFFDVTASLAPELQFVGMTSSALWTDVDNDGDRDLMVVGEWMSPRLFENLNGQLKDITNKSGLEGSLGWWNSINGGDFDNDGDIDYVLGNSGLDYRFRASQESPLRMYVDDFDSNGSLDHVQAYQEGGVWYPLRMRKNFLSHFPSFLKELHRPSMYSSKTLGDLFPDSLLRKSSRFELTTMSSSIAINLGSGTFAISALPKLAQISPIYGTKVADFNGDGNLDILAVGNFFSPDQETWGNDAGRGLVLLGNGKGTFEPLAHQYLGVDLIGESRAIVAMPGQGGRTRMVVSNCNGPLEVFELNRSQGSTKGVPRLSVKPASNGERKPMPVPSKTETYDGAGFNSQSGSFR